jgi:alkylation response protein AidB-like acyl-CoA dehydrogenase
MSFLQDPPQLSNTYTADAPLREMLLRLLPAPLHATLQPEWLDLGAAAAGPLLQLARSAEAALPRHVPFDPWGRRIDEVWTSGSWGELHAEAARRGLVAIPYEGKLGAFARLHQFALLHLYGPSSAIASCPLAMTDGAARTLLEHRATDLVARALPRLTSRDPRTFWTSGQWMTERSGGSDVSGTETEARPDGEGRYRLHGNKWFTSAITADMALTLARVEGVPGLSLFYVETRREDGTLNGVRVLRLKDKLGTRALPTAEIDLEGALAFPVGELGHGVRKITPLLNTTRLHNAVAATGLMARALHLLRDYAGRRSVFGRPLRAHPLQVETFAELQVEYEAALALTFEAVRLLGRLEAGEASTEERAALRLVTPLAKLMTGKQAVAVVSEALEGFGGSGYMEDTGLPVLLRDAQVLPIWEGTTNVLSLDALRACQRDGALSGWAGLAARRLSELRCVALEDEAQLLGSHLVELDASFGRVLRADPDAIEASARRVALKLAALAAGLALLEQAAWALANGHGERSAVVARRWLRGLAAFDEPLTDLHRRESAVLAG